jgi:hypothetical protein
MSFDNFEVEYHLTPKGWIEGSRWYLGAKHRDVPPPKNRVETWRRHSEQSSQWFS